MTAEACTVPIDVTKVRLQIQQSTKGAVFKYRGMLHAGFTIAKEEGLTALYKGLAPALFRQASYAGLRMAIYERARVLVIRDGPPAMWEKVLAGGSAGALAAAITTPTDVVKVRLQAEGKLPPGVKPRYRGTFHAFYTIAKEEGLRGLYRGVVPNVQRAAVINAAELSSYDQVKQILIKQTRYTGGDTFWSHLGASLIAGLVGTILANPIDVLKTRIMNQKPGPDGVYPYKGALDCLLKTVRYEGIAALYKGFIPNYARIGNATSHLPHIGQAHGVWLCS